MAALGGLHVVVNNAGAIRRNQRLHEIDVATWHEQIAVNLTGHFLVLHAALPHLLASEGDRAIVNVGSTLAHKVVPGLCRLRRRQGRSRVADPACWPSSTGPDGIPRQRRDAGRRPHGAGAHRPSGLRRAPGRHGARLSAAAPRRARGRRRGDRLARVSDRAGWITGTIVDVDGGFSVT